MRFHNSASSTDLKDTVLLIPAISVGNIPQLTTDLLLHTLDFAKVATLDDTYLYPFASPVDYSSDDKQPSGISLGIEAYLSKEHNITLIQQRAPLLPGFAANHVQEVLLPFIKAGQFKQVVFLNLSDAGLVEHFVPGEIKVFTDEDILSQSLLAMKIDESQVQPLAETPHNDSPYAKSVIDTVGKTANLSVLVTYVYEGDNSYDALNMATRVCDALNVKNQSWKIPVSWLGVYGDRPAPLAMEEGMYG